LILSGLARAFFALFTSHGGWLGSFPTFTDRMHNALKEVVTMTEEKKEWKDKIVQIQVSENGDLILIPRIGNERFIYGPPDKSEEKFEKIKKYYSAIVPEMGYEKYSEVDLRFNGQIICR
jgi:cell division protein FtsQ